MSFHTRFFVNVRLCLADGLTQDVSEQVLATTEAEAFAKAECLAAAVHGVNLEHVIALGASGKLPLTPARLVQRARSIKRWPLRIVAGALGITFTKAYVLERWGCRSAA
jgi:hypothetical protein